MLQAQPLEGRGVGGFQATEIFGLPKNKMNGSCRSIQHQELPAWTSGSCACGPAMFLQTLRDGQKLVRPWSGLSDAI